jgi:hypothetical protein
MRKLQLVVAALALAAAGCSSGDASTTTTISIDGTPLSELPPCPVAGDPVDAAIADGCQRDGTLVLSAWIECAGGVKAGTIDDLAGVEGGTWAPGQYQCPPTETAPFDEALFQSLNASSADVVTSIEQNAGILVVQTSLPRDAEAGPTSMGLCVNAQAAGWAGDIQVLAGDGGPLASTRDALCGLRV